MSIITESSIPAMRPLAPLESEKARSGLDIRLNDLWSLAWRRKWLFALGLMIAGLLGSLYYFQKKPVYESTAQLMIIKKQTGLENEQINSMAEHQDLVSRDLLSTQMVVLRSPKIVHNAIERAHLDERASLAALIKPDMSLTHAIIKRLKVTKGGSDAHARDASTITISFRGLDPEDCRVVVDEIIASYLLHLGESSRDVGLDAIELISKAKDELSEQLTLKTEAYHDFLRNTPLLLGPKREKGDATGNMHAARMVRLEAKRAELRVDYLEAKTHLEQLENALERGESREALLHSIQKGGGLRPAGSQHGTETSLETELASLSIRRASLLQKMGIMHPDIRAIDSQIADIRNSLVGADGAGNRPKDYLGMYLAGIRHEIAEMEAHDRELAADFELEKRNAKALLEEELREQELRSELARGDKLYDTIVERLQKVNFVKDYGAYNTALIAAPEPGLKVAPRWWMVGAISLVLGLIGGCGLVFVVESGDQTFHTSEEIRDRLSIPIVAEIPFMESEHRRKVQTSSPLAGCICSFHRPNSRFAEAYRAVRTALYFGAHGEGHKVIQVTSASPGDGKSTLAVNLAVSIAQSGMKVLLIDADMRRPRIDRLLGIENGAAGLSSAITGEVEVQDAIRPTGVDNLWCLPSGPRPANPSELLSLGRFKDLLDVLRDKFDFVILDTPPLLVVTDPCVVAPRVDGVLVTVRLRKNSRFDMHRAMEELGALGARVVGVVVNAVRARDGHRYAYYSAYSAARGRAMNGDHNLYYTDDDGFATNGSRNNLDVR